MLKNLEGMSFKQKVDYIWEYYKIHIIIILICIYSLFSMINHFFINPPAKTYISITFIGEAVDDEKLNFLKNDLDENFVPKDINFESVINNFYNSESPDVNTANAVKFNALLLAGDLDLILSENSDFEVFKTQGDVFWDLKELFPEIEKYGSVIKENGKIIAIKLEKSPVLDRINFDYTDKILFVPLSCKRIEETKDLFEYLLKQ